MEMVLTRGPQETQALLSTAVSDGLRHGVCFYDGFRQGFQAGCLIGHKEFGSNLLMKHDQEEHKIA